MTFDFPEFICKSFSSVPMYVYTHGFPLTVWCRKKVIREVDL